LICHPEVAAFATEGSGRAARSVASFATLQSRVWLASLPDCREFRPRFQYSHFGTASKVM
jgi:hypothetical protein